MGEKVETKNEGKHAAAAPEVVEEAAAAEGGGNKAEPCMTVVLKLDLHCEGCSKKVRRSVSHLEGVVTVKADCDAKKLTVTGNVDPTWLRDKVEAKTKKKVELISPPHPNKDGGGSGGAGAAGGDNKPEEKKVGEAEKKQPEDTSNTKPKEAAVSTVTMKTKLHCDGCAHKIKRIIIRNFDGVDSVTTDLQKDSITVIGKMEVKELLAYLRERLKRGVEIVPPKQDGGAAGDEKVKGSGGGGGGEEKKEKKVEGGGEETMMKKMEHRSSYNAETHYAMMPMGMGMGMHDEYGMYHHHHQSYMNTGHVAGPPLPPPTYVNMNDTTFSDDNPNGCHVM